MDGWRKCDKDESHVVHILNFNIYRSRVENVPLCKKNMTLLQYFVTEVLKAGNESKLSMVLVHLGLGDPSDSGSTN